MGAVARRSTWDEAVDEDEPAAQEDVAMSTAGGGVSDWQDDDMDHAERMTSMLEDTRQALYAVLLCAPDHDHSLVVPFELWDDERIGLTSRPVRLS